MDFITTTDLRTQTPALIQTLSQGKSVKLIHRSKMVGDIHPIENNQVKILDIKAFKASIAALNKIIPPIPYSLKERDRLYRLHLQKKYG